jgi:plastocyanin
MKKPKARRNGFLRVSFLATVAWALVLQAAPIANPVDPPAVSDTLAPTYSIGVDKTVQTPEIPPRPDIVFLADTTGSMTDPIENVQDNAATIMSDVDAGTSGTPFFAAAQYRDTGDTPLFAVDQGMTDDQLAVDAAIQAWSAGGGGDTPECQLYALEQLATGAVTFRSDATKVIVWFGDASGHDPCNGATEASATAALVAAEILVIAIDVNTGGADGLNNTGQASRIAAATGGQFFPNLDPDDVADVILAALSNLPITVVPAPVGCDPLVVSFDPASATVTSGDPVYFTETISVPADASVAGQTVNCTVEFRDEDGNLLAIDGEQAIQYISIDIPLAIDLEPDTEINELSEDNGHEVIATVTSLDVPLGLGGKMVEFEVTGTNPGFAGAGLTDAAGQVTFGYSVPISCNSLGSDTITGCTNRADSPDVFGTCDSVTKDWVDTIPPEADCVPSENPNGNNEPPAPGEGGQGQNQDGFYEMLAEDNLVDDCDPLQMFVRDTGSGTLFGPFAVGTEIKYIEDPDATPEIAPMGGNSGNGDGKSKDVDWRIKGTGDAEVIAVDQSGNVSDPAACLVPPPPQ